MVNLLIASLSGLRYIMQKANKEQGLNQDIQSLKLEF